MLMLVRGSSDGRLTGVLSRSTQYGSDSLSVQVEGRRVFKPLSRGT
jgi:hypothetical protein